MPYGRFAKRSRKSTYGTRTYQSRYSNKAAWQRVNRKTYSLKPMRFPAIARSAGYNKYATTRTFTNTCFMPLNEVLVDTTSFMGTAAGANDGLANTRNNSFSFYPKLTDFAGFRAMAILHEMIKPISITVKARIFKMGTLNNNDGTLLRGCAGINYVNNFNDPSTGGPTDPEIQPNSQGGSMPSPGLWDYMEVRSCIDYDGKQGSGGDIKYNLTDFLNAGNSSLSYINGRYMKTVAQWSPRQYVSAPSGLAGESAAPVMDKSQFFPIDTFYNWDPTTNTFVDNPNTPRFAGLNVFATSYDAAGNGYNGTTADNKPVLYVQYNVELKCAFKGKIKNREIPSVPSTLINVTVGDNSAN